MKSAPAIVFDFSPSRWIAAAIGAITGLGLIALAFCGMPLWATFVVAAVACAYSGHCLRQFVHNPVRRVAWYAAGHWRLADGDGAEQLADLEQGIVRASWIVLRLRRSDGARVAVILGPDNSNIDTRRRLRVRLARMRDAAGQVT